jgi:hypothetical protein
VQCTQSVLDHFVQSNPGRCGLGDLGEKKTDGGRFVNGPVGWVAPRVLVVDGEIDQGLNEPLEPGIGGVPLAGLVTSEVETSEARVREGRFLVLDPFGDVFG